MYCICKCECVFVNVCVCVYVLTLAEWNWFFSDDFINCSTFCISIYIDFACIHNEFRLCFQYSWVSVCVWGFERRKHLHFMGMNCCKRNFAETSGVNCGKSFFLFHCIYISSETLDVYETPLSHWWHQKRKKTLNAINFSINPMMYR